MRRALKMLGLVFVSASALFSASASAQAPEPIPTAFALREVMRNAESVTFVDERGIRRTGPIAHAWAVSVTLADRTLPSGAVVRGGLTQYAFDCDARTSQPLHVAIIAPDLAVTEIPVSARPAQPVAAPLGDALDLVCGLRTTLPGARATSIAYAITQARAPNAPALAAAPPVPLPRTARLAAIGGDVTDGSQLTYFFDEASRRPVSDRSSGWIFIAFAEDRTISGQAVSSMWQLGEANCAAQLFRGAGIAMIGADLTTVLAQTMNPTTPAQPAAEGTTRRRWLELICGAATVSAGARFASGADAVRAARAEAAASPAR